MSGVRNITVYTFFKGHAFFSTKIITLPVTSTVTTFSPVLFNIVAVNNQFVCGAFVKASKVATQHNKIGTHSQSKGNVVVVNNSAIRTNRNINACLCVVFITGFCNFYCSCCLTTTNTFLFTSNTNGTTTDSYFNKVCTIFCKEHKAIAVNNITSTNFYILAKLVVNIMQSSSLPLTVTFT